MHDSDFMFPAHPGIHGKLFQRWEFRSELNLAFPGHMACLDSLSLFGRSKWSISPPGGVQLVAVLLDIWPWSDHLKLVTDPRPAVFRCCDEADPQFLSIPERDSSVIFLGQPLPSRREPWFSQFGQVHTIPKPGPVYLAWMNQSYCPQLDNAFPRANKNADVWQVHHEECCVLVSLISQPTTCWVASWAALSPVILRWLKLKYQRGSQASWDDADSVM